MSIANNPPEILDAIRPPFTALILYGSHARGDAAETSDVDVLQVTTAHTPPYAVGPLNVTCYTIEQLMRIACRGGLFVRHLVQEARPILDPENVLGAIKSAYVALGSYDAVREEVCGCAPLLDVAESHFFENANGLTSTASYLIRTYLYATAFDQGARSFAMTHVLDTLDEHRAGVTLSNLRSHRNFSAFTDAREVFEELTGTTCQRTEGSLEAFIVNESGKNELAMILGLRLLARGRPFTYDVLLDVEFQPWPRS